MHHGLLEVEEGVLLVHGAEEQQNIGPGVRERAQPNKYKIKNGNGEKISYINSHVMLIIKELVSFRCTSKTPLDYVKTTICTLVVKCSYLS